MGYAVIAVIAVIALGVALAVLGISLWRARTRAARAFDDVWSAGTDPDPAQSRAKKSVAGVAVGTVGGGCGGCGGCGCGG
jgi:hypothetical protein